MTEETLLEETRLVFNTGKPKWPGQFTDSKTFLQQAKIVGSYNNFNPYVAEEMVNFFGEVQYRLAREYSVAVYVKSSKDVPIGAFYADEADREDETTWRFWWD